MHAQFVSGNLGSINIEANMYSTRMALIGLCRMDHAVNRVSFTIDGAIDGQLQFAGSAKDGEAYLRSI